MESGAMAEAAAAVGDTAARRGIRLILYTPFYILVHYRITEVTEYKAALTTTA